MSRWRLVGSYFISLAVLWLVTSIAVGVWLGSVLEGSTSLRRCFEWPACTVSYAMV